MQARDGIEVRRVAPGQAPAAPPPAPDRLTLVRCIGCGAIDPSRDCLAICEDHALELVEADRHDRVEQRARLAETAADALRAVVLALANAPAGGDALARYRALQDDARFALRTAAAATAPADEDDDEPAEVVRAWSCAACGRVEAPQPCLGVCVRHPTEFVRADVHRRALAVDAAATEAIARLAPLARQLAWSTPRDGGHAAALSALGQRARSLTA